jgi:hypothetical protein
MKAVGSIPTDQLKDYFAQRIFFHEIFHSLDFDKVAVVALTHRIFGVFFYNDNCATSQNVLECECVARLSQVLCVSREKVFP